MRRHLLKALVGCGFGATLFAQAPAEAAVVISKNPTANMACSAGVCTATAADAVVNVTDLETRLATGSATVSTGGAIASNIVLDASLSWASANTLTLDAYRSVTVDKPISVAGAGGLTIVTNDGGRNGALSFRLNGHIGFLGLTNVLSINGATYKLEADIADLASDIAANPGGNYALAGAYDAKSDGTYTSSPVETWFTGNFEGLGNTISHLRINDRTDLYVGLFAFINNGKVSDLKVIEAKVVGGGNSQGDVSVGILAGVVNGSLYADPKGGAKHKRASYGGTISGVMTSGSVRDAVTSGDGAALGGVVGTACSSNATTVSLVINSQSSADISGASNVSGFAGGLVGYNCENGVVETSFATGSVTSSNGYAGGLVGASTGSILNSYATGSAGTGNQQPTGNFPPNSAGGLLGYNFEATVTDSYSTGAATTGSGGYAGGFIGYDFDNDGGFSENYWDVTTSGNSTGLGSSPGSTVATGLTTSQLQSGLPSGFSPTTWKEDPTINSGLPYLIDNPPPVH